MQEDERLVATQAAAAQTPRRALLALVRSPVRHSTALSTFLIVVGADVCAHGSEFAGGSDHTVDCL
jgi:hypothetical protein